MADYKENLNKNIDMFRNATDKMWEMWMSGLNSLKWNADQIDNLTISQLDMARNARQEFVKQMEEMIKQMHTNHVQMMKMVEDSVLSGYQQIEQATQTMKQEIGQKVGGATKK